MLVCAYRAQEVDVPEAGPVDVGEVQLGVCQLPQQEVGDPDLPRRAEDQVRVRQPLGGDVPRYRLLGDVVDGQPPVHHVLGHGADGVDYVLAAPIGYGQVQMLVVVAGRPLVGVVHGPPDALREGVPLAYDPDGHPVLVHRRVVGEPVEGLLQELHQVVHLVGVAVEVLHGERVDRQDPYVQVHAPLEDLLDLLAAQLVPCHRALAQDLLRVPAVAVHYDGDVLGHLAGLDLPLQSGFVGRVGLVRQDALDVHVTRSPRGCRPP